MQPIMDLTEITAQGRRAMVPFYQPIVSVSDGSIFGYEVLGRYLDDNGRAESMGYYFSDPSVSSYEKLLRSRKIREMAFHYASMKEFSGRLFVNVKPSWLVDVHRAGSELPTIQFIKNSGLSASQIVIEITEDEFDGDLFILNSVIERYREVGCKIAVDDFTFNNFDRLIHLKPDFVKIDIRLVKQSVQSKEYHKLITSISNFAQEIGVTVLFEGVEYEEELASSIMAGGSLIQGFYFAKADKEFQDGHRFPGIIQETLDGVIESQRVANYNVLELEQKLNHLIAPALTEIEFQSHTADEQIQTLLPRLPENCYRIYVCDHNGRQISSNYKRTNGAFSQQQEYHGKNWAWRPYFFHNLTRMDKFQRGFMSERYIDQETKQETITYSHPISEHMYLFLDFVI